MVVSSGTQIKKPRVLEEEYISEEEEEEKSRSKTETDEDEDEDETLNFNQSEVDLKEGMESEDYISESEQQSLVSKSKLRDSKDPNMSAANANPTENSSDEETDDDDDDEEEEESEDMDDNFDDGDDGKEENDDAIKTDRRSSGLADVMAKILASQDRKSLLSKAKKDWDIKDEPDEDSFEVVDSIGMVKKEPHIKIEREEKEESFRLHDKIMMKKIWEKRFRVKPNLEEDHEKERKLKVLATQGVVQLFGAIEKHRNMIQKKLSETRSVMGREKVLESAGKEAFMEVLRGEGRKVKKKTVTKAEVKVKREVEEIQLPAAKKNKWNVFSDDFYQEPTLQGWDQKSDED
ncbi:hypothetical protein Pmani_026855 [Petrolisthes manimaculis]|uniref:RRP15-like protein n=1 Tax=Petrolisthes manimaculis TaxID=1843537 RepID=A0AAE1P3V8_9EUCA|nr:hypothetical protein Pmani_026855 [Petrolisthes manimaculis]